MRYLFLFLMLAVPFYGAAAQSVTLDNGTLTIGPGVVELGGGMLYVGTNGMLDEAGGRIDTNSMMMTSPARSFSAPATTDSLGGLGFMITTAVSPGDVTVVAGHTPMSGNGNTSIRRYYDVTATNNTNLDATVVFHYHDAELNGHAEADLVLFRSTDGGTTWTAMGGTVDTDANTITVSGVDGFSMWTAAASTAPLPVELATFEGQVDGAEVVLRWSTASETNNAGFEVLHRAGETWQALGFVEGYGTTHEAQAYSYRAAGLVPGRHVFRLRQVDFDGAFDFSPEVEVTVGVPGPFQLTPAYPNPFNPQTNFTLAVQVEQRVQVRVFDLLGRQVSVLHDGLLEAGEAHRFTFGGASLPSGTYLLSVEGETFRASRKLVLMK